ncbi:MAG TPA: hypothetical protein PLB91_07575 [Spirochaetales bacterium]|nr:hypothetical protein [Spirochaetales bacterium]
MRRRSGTTGLLQKAAKLRVAKGLSSTGTGAVIDAELGAGSGINEDDKREILEAIDKVARSNRLSAAPEALEAAPRRRGLAFPLLVNAAALVITLLLILGIRRAFELKESASTREGGAISSAEGMLIQEIKRESESLLREKDRAIEEASARLAALDKERSSLASGMEARIAEREAALRAALAAELEKERARLTAQGLAEAAIQARLATFEAERRAAFDTELEAFKRQAKAESELAEARYAELREEYRSTLSGLAAERKRIQDDSRRREEELRSSLEAKARELESRSAEAAAGLERARAELASLEERRRSDAAIEERLLGLYALVRAALRERRFESAAAGADALFAYLSEPAVAAAPSLQARREADLFAARALGDLARSELARSGADATKLLRQAELLAAASEASAAAERALRSGDESGARAKYREALEKVPSILSAHEYFLGRLREEEALRRARFSDALAQAQAAQRAGELEAARARYAEALAYLPLEEQASKDTVARIGQLGAALAELGRLALSSSAAREGLLAARRDLSASRWPEAIRGFVSVLSLNPGSDQAREASRGVEESLAGLAREAESRAASDAAAIASLRAETSRLGSESAGALADLRAENARLAAESGERGSRLAELERLLAESRAETARAAAAAQAAPPAATAAAATGDRAALGAEVERLSALGAKYERVSSSYAAYAAAEDAALATGSAGSLIEARSALDAFLSGPEAREALPGLGERIARYEGARQEAGQREVLYNALDLVDGALGARDAAARSRYYAELERRYSGDKAMLDFLAGLKKSLR